MNRKRTKRTKKRTTKKRTIERTTLTAIIFLVVFVMFVVPLFVARVSSVVRDDRSPLHVRAHQRLRHRVLAQTSVPRARSTDAGDRARRGLRLSRPAWSGQEHDSEA